MTSPFERMESQRVEGAPSGSSPMAKLSALKDRVGGVIRSGDDYLVRAYPSGIEVWRFVPGQTVWLERVEVRPSPAANEEPV